MPRIEFSTEVTVEFVPIPPQKEEAYWAAIRYFAEVMFANVMTEATTEGGEIKIPQTG